MVTHPNSLFHRETEGQDIIVRSDKTGFLLEDCVKADAVEDIMPSTGTGITHHRSSGQQEGKEITGNSVPLRSCGSAHKCLM